jgi:GNAT superfamily N-acetyltransferase
VRIRAARSSDGDFIAALSSRFAECDVPPWRTKDEIVNGTARRLAVALERGNTDDSAIFIAENHGGALGFAWTVIIDDFYTGEPVGKVSEIAVTRSGGGAGKALMQACEQWAREAGARLMVLNALEGNAYARRFYALRGYAPEYTTFAKLL